MVGAFDPKFRPKTSGNKTSGIKTSGTDQSGAGKSGILGSKASRRSALGLILGAPLLGACAGVQQSISQFSVPNPFSSSSPAPTAGPVGPQQQSVAIGTGNVKVALILPLSAGGNAGVAAQSMKNASEMALAEFLSPNLQLLIKDDAGSPQGAQQAAQLAVDEGAEIILGPLFAASVPAVAQVARARNISVIAFSTDSSVASRGVYLLSFLPESDVNRIVDYAAGTGKRSFVAMLPENAYGNVVEAAFKQAVPRRGGRVVAFEKYGADRATATRNIVAALGQADSLLLADDGEAVVSVADGLVAAGANLKNLQLLGTGLWDNPRVFGSPHMQGGLYAAPDPAGFRAFAARYRSKYGGEPVRTATLAYDAVALVAALSRTQGGKRFTSEVLLNASGFAGIDGLFRFRAEGTNERGLAVMRVASGGPTSVAGSPRSFGA
ncbi:MAG: penicillin-binding protein activator [Bradyrhizobium sp.]|uniref:penicillin-binding protein activator n=1 Tax=Bradyrhizobium sp. TaxID=376 RepID=UPI003BAE3E87